MKQDNSLRNWRVERSQIGFIGEGLQRLRCLLAASDGTILAAVSRAGAAYDPSTHPSLNCLSIPHGGRILLSRTQAAGQPLTYW